MRAGTSRFLDFEKRVHYRREIYLTTSATGKNILAKGGRREGLIHPFSILSRSWLDKIPDGRSGRDEVFSKSEIPNWVDRVYHAGFR